MSWNSDFSETSAFSPFIGRPPGAFSHPFAFRLRTVRGVQPMILAAHESFAASLSRASAAGRVRSAWEVRLKPG
jgi:hypothetical protein